MGCGVVARLYTFSSRKWGRLGGIYSRLNAFLVGETDGFLLVCAPSRLFLERVDSVDHIFELLRILRRSWVQISNKLAEAVNISFT